jgi:hypothetical protein
MTLTTDFKISGEIDFAEDAKKRKDRTQIPPIPEVMQRLIYAMEINIDRLPIASKILS